MAAGAHGGFSLARSVALVAVAWIGLALVAAVQAAVPWRSLVGLRPGPDVAFLVVLYVALAQRGGVAEVAGTAFVVGYLADLSGSTPKGLHVLAGIVSSLPALSLSRRLLVRGPMATLLVAAFFGALHHTLLALMRTGLDPALALTPFRMVPPTVLSTALFAPPLFWLLIRIERRLERDRRAVAARGR